MSSAFNAIHEVPVPLVNEPVHKFVVPDPDLHIFGISHPNHVGLIQSPLASGDDMAHGHHSHPDVKDDHGHEQGHGREDEGHHGSVSSSSNEKRDADPDEPVLRKAHEAPTIQLFFDLYFVANLTTFSAQHDIHNANELRSYLGYFTMIWFTWFQNTMFDVRFSNDSVFERFCKAAQFGVMTGFAITGPGYQTGFTPGTGEAQLAVSAFKTLSLILMVSRLVLTFQYSVALFWLKGYKKAWLPMCGHITVMFVAAMIFLGLYFAFSEQESETVLAGWYVVFVLEAWAINLISGRTPFLSFRSTVLVERLGLLTLIILGEGIISMSNALNSVGTDNAYGAPIIGAIICCVVVTYLMYMLYFDNVQPDRMGNFRQHIWAIMHFPLHASIVLVEEAQAQLAIWQKVIDISLPLKAAVSAVSLSRPTTDQITNLQNTLNGITSRFLVLSTNTASGATSAPDESEYFKALSNSTSNSTGVLTALNRIEADGLDFICGKFNIDLDTDLTGQEAFNAIFSLYEVVYVYFFAFAGLVLIVLSILFMIGKRHKLRGELFAVALRFSAGLGLALLSTFAAPGLQDPSGQGNDNLHRFMYSGMMIPTVLLVYLTVLVLDNLLIRYIKSVVKWRLNLHHHKNIPKVERPDLAAQDAPANAMSPRRVHENGARIRQEEPKSPIRTTAREADPESEH